MPFVRRRCQGTPGVSGEVSRGGVELQRAHRAVHQHGLGSNWWDNSPSGKGGGYVDLQLNVSWRRWAVARQKGNKAKHDIGILTGVQPSGCNLCVGECSAGALCPVWRAALQENTMHFGSGEEGSQNDKRDPEDMPPGIKLEGCFACRKAGGRQAGFQAQVALNRLLWRGGQ